MNVATTPAKTATASNALGFESLESEVRVDSLPLSGALPGWLQGSLVRTGPAKWEVGERTMNHWFDGLAMLHRFGFAGGVRSPTPAASSRAPPTAPPRRPARSATPSSRPTPAGRCSSG